MTTKVTGSVLESSGVAAGSYGTTTAVPAITVDAQGRITSVSTNATSALSNLTAGNLTGTIPSAVAWAALPAGTVTTFQQPAAPTGWTKLTTHDDTALRVVSGAASSGGSVAFSAAFASQAVSGSVGSTTLAASQIPSHTHGWSGSGSSTTAAGTAVIQDPGHAHNLVAATNSGGGGGVSIQAGSTPAGGRVYASGTGVYDSGHAHTFSYALSGTTDNGTGGNTGHNHTFTGTSINMAVNYVDLILASKN